MAIKAALKDQETAGIDSKLAAMIKGTVTVRRTLPMLHPADKD
jgi:hypothetical protein